MNNQDIINNIDIKAVRELVSKIGAELAKMQGSVSCEDKEDGSPVSEADFMASRMLIKELAKITPDIVVISEENSKADNIKASKARVKWITDPLDGTRSFLRGHEGYGCHLALIIDGEATLGFISLPSSNPDNSKLYYTDKNGNAFLVMGNNKTKLKIEDKDRTAIAAIGWRDKKIDNFLGVDVDTIQAIGGARICTVVENIADIAIFDGHFSYWDLAAAHAIIKAAGGSLYDKQSFKEIKYNGDDFIVPPSMACSKKVLGYLHPKINKTRTNRPRNNGPHI